MLEHRTKSQASHEIPVKTIAVELPLASGGARGLGVVQERGVAPLRGTEPRQARPAPFASAVRSSPVGGDDRWHRLPGQGGPRGPRNRPRRLEQLANSLKMNHPSAAAPLREGMEETPKCSASGRETPPGGGHGLPAPRAAPNPVGGGEAELGHPHVMLARVYARDFAGVCHINV